MLMFDLHCHSIFSDGELIPSELVRRLEVMGYGAVAVTDHADESNFDFVIERISRAAVEINRFSDTMLLPGIELTHVHPERILPLVRRCREAGAVIVVCHGETVVEPVIPGTNRAAIEAGVDILAHPGLIAFEEARLAAEREVRLELSGRKGHGLTNGHVLKMARQAGASLVIDSDGHAPGDFMSPERGREVGIGAGMEPEEVESLYQANWNWLKGLF